MEHDKFDPGAARNGNFINYYSFQNSEERINLIPFELFGLNDKCAVGLLDIGCNTGELTEQLHENISKITSGEVHTLGLDLDEILIYRAKERNANRNVTYKCLDVVRKEMFLEATRIFLSNKPLQLFDVAFLFSVTMWIHLNHGDEVLLEFLFQVASISRIVVIEPQPWKCYKSAARRAKRACQEQFPYYNKIKLPTDIEDFIDGFMTQKCSFSKIYESGKTQWGRKILIYRKI